jgi:hypothetical protein
MDFLHVSRMNFALKWFVPTIARIPFKNTVQKKK